MQSDLFMTTIAHYLALAKDQGENPLNTLRSIVQVMALAPLELQSAMTALAKTLGLLPEAVGYLGDGLPLYRLEDVAEKLELSLEEAEAVLNAFIAERETMGLSNKGVVVDSAQIHRIQ